MKIYVLAVLVLSLTACGGTRSATGGPGQFTHEDPGAPNANQNNQTNSQPNAQNSGQNNGQTTQDNNGQNLNANQATPRLKLPEAWNKQNGSRGNYKEGVDKKSDSPVPWSTGNNGQNPQAKPGTAASAQNESVMPQWPGLNINPPQMTDDTTAAPTIKMATDMLVQFESGKKYAAEINGENPYKLSVAIKLASAAEVQKSSINGGLIISPVQGPSFIVANGEASPGDLAQIIAHQAQHVFDEMEEEAYLNQNQALKEKVFNTVKKFKAAGQLSFSSEDLTNVNFVLKSMLCSEARAYNRNLTLISEGLTYTIDSLKKMSLGQLIVTQYIAKTGFILPGDADALVKECLAAPTFTDYLKALK